MRQTIAALALAASLPLATLAAGCASTPAPVLTADGRIPVIFHVTSGEPTAWNQSLNNAANYQRNMGPNKVFVEIAVNGPGIRMLLAESPVEPRVTAALTNGVKIVACEETMKALKLTRQDMIPGIGYVPGGIIEVVDRQREGYAYIHY
jgi:hypothetical protein